MFYWKCTSTAAPAAKTHQKACLCGSNFSFSKNNKQGNKTEFCYPVGQPQSWKKLQQPEIARHPRHLRKFFPHNVCTLEGNGLQF